MKNKSIPFDYFAALKMTNWRDDFHWMLSEEKAQRLFTGLNNRIMDYAKTLSADRKVLNLFLLAIPIIRNRLIELQLVTLNVQAADENDTDLVSTLAELNFLKTGNNQYFSTHVGFDLIEKKIKLLALRRILRTFSWTQWWKLPWAVLKPEVIAIAHNDALRRKASISNKKIYFYQAAELFKNARAQYEKQEITIDLEKFAEEIFFLLVDKQFYNATYLSRLKLLGIAFIKGHLLTSSQDLDALYRYHRLPKNLWIGSGGSYASRAIALATLYHGGLVTSFAHATGTVLTSDYDALEMAELAVTSEFVDLSPAAAKRIDKYYPIARRKSFYNYQFSSIDGSPHYKKYVAKINNIARDPEKPTVVYTPTETTLFIGPIYTSNMVYLDWQLRLVQMLRTMPINLICQPHPQGIFRDRNLVHPLREAFNIPYRRFEDIIDQADVFLVDFIHSTIFGEMLASNLPIVRIALNDNARNGIHRDVKPLLDKRCRTVPVFFGADNLPYVDKDQLEYAIVNDWQEKVNSDAYRELLLDKHFR